MSYEQPALEEVLIRPEVMISVIDGEEYVTGGSFLKRIGLGKVGVRYMTSGERNNPFGVSKRLIAASDIYYFNNPEVRYALRRRLRRLKGPSMILSALV